MGKNSALELQWALWGVSENSVDALPFSCCRMLYLKPCWISIYPWLIRPAHKQSTPRLLSTAPTACLAWHWPWAGRTGTVWKTPMRLWHLTCRWAGAVSNLKSWDVTKTNWNLCSGFSCLLGVGLLCFLHRAFHCWCYPVRNEGAVVVSEEAGGSLVLR